MKKHSGLAVIAILFLTIGIFKSEVQAADTTPPDVPAQYAPSGETGDTTFIWSISEGATSYSIWICDASLNGIYYQTFDVSDSNTEFDLIGTWTLFYKWDECNGVYSYTSITFNEDNTFSTRPGVQGTWTLDGTQLTWIYSDGSPTYSGTIDLSTGTAEGTMSTSEGRPGCWMLQPGSPKQKSTRDETYSTVIDSSYFTPGQVYYWFVCASNSLGDSWSWDQGGMSFYIPEDEPNNSDNPDNPYEPVDH